MRFWTPRIGERLGELLAKGERRFEVRQPLGRGGMGVVFRAWDHRVHRDVALKFLNHSFSVLSTTSAQLPAQFPSLDQEAIAVAQLRHENIVDLFDLCEWTAPDGTRVPFLIMELLEGSSLRDLLQERMELDCALELFREICKGLDHAHTHNVIHRDLKPSNVFVTEYGKVKLLDFGLAHLLEAGAALLLPTAGTPPYMAPEQFQPGHSLDKRTDVWAAGLLLYEMLTGRLPHPFRGKDDCMRWALSAEPVPSVRQEQPQVPNRVARIISRALEKNPAKRFRDATELLAAVNGLEPRAPRPLPTRTVAEQRQVWMLCCEWRDLRTDLAPEVFAEREQRYHRHCREIVERGGGSTILACGHKVVACFGYPQSEENEGERAVLSGLEIVRTLQRELSPNGEACARIGIHADLMLVESSAREASPSLQGQAEELAAWLAKQAEPDTVVVSQVAHDLLRGAFEIRPAGARPFPWRGRETPVTFGHVARERRSSSRFERTRSTGGLTPLVGRERELALLTRLWERTQTAHGGMVLIRGESGIGKSRLILEFVRRVKPDARARAQCWPQSSDSPYRPVVELLNRAFALDRGGGDARAQQRFIQHLQARGLDHEHARGVTRLLTLSSSNRERSELPWGNPEHDLAREAVAQLLLREAEDQSVLITLEDVQWADPSTLRLISHLAERINPSRLLLVMSAHPDFTPGWSSAPWLNTITLERLTPEATGELARRASMGHQPLSDSQLAQVVARSEGVPLYIEELTRWMLERKHSEGALLGSSSIPLKLWDMFNARLNRVSTFERELAQMGAVLGRSFPGALLAALLGRDESEIERELDELVDAGVLERLLHESECRYQFRHALLQNAAYEQLTTTTRQEAHQRIADCLERRFPELAEREPELVAYHHSQGGRPEPAIRWWIRAAENASRYGAFEETIRHLQRGLDQAGLVKDQRARARHEFELRCALRFPLFALRESHAPHIAKNNARLAELAREQAPRCSVVPDMFELRISIHFGQVTPPLMLQMAEEICHLGEELGDMESLLVGHRLAGVAYSMQGHQLAAREHLLSATRCAGTLSLEQHRTLAMKQLSSPATAAEIQLAYVSVLLDEPRAFQRYCRQALALARRIDHPLSHAYTLTYAASGYRLLGDVPSVMRCADKAVAICRERGLWLAECWAGMIRSWAISELGNPRQALEEFQMYFARQRQAKADAVLKFFLALSIDMHLRLGTYREALEVVHEAWQWIEAREQHDYDAEIHRLQGVLLHALGHNGEAEHRLRKALEVAHGQTQRLFWLRAVMDLGRLLGTSGRRAEVAALLEEAIQRYGMRRTATYRQCVEVLEEMSRTH